MGRGFSELRKLKELHFAKGNADCDIIRSKMFDSLINVTSLKYLDLSGLGIKILYSPVFKYLPFLETLILNDNPALGTTGYAINFFAEFFPHLKHLHLVNVRVDNCHMHLLLSRMRGTKLKSLILDRNIISKIDDGIYEEMRSLETISMSYNRMSSPVDLTAELLELPNLRFLNLSHQNQLIPQRANRIRRGEHDYVSHFCFSSLNFGCVVRFPENLTHVDLSYSGLHLPAIPEIAMMNNNSLEFVYLSSNSIRRMPKPFYCPFNNSPFFKLVDLSNNKLECINSSYFNHCNWSHLNVLNLSGNRFRKVFEKECNQNMTYFLGFLRPLWNLTKLDLSGNMINNNLLFDSFENQKLLEELYISKMGFKNLPIKISQMERLKYLDISFNNLECFSREVMIELSNLSSIQQQIYNKTVFKVNLNNNPLRCNCKCYPFLKWLKATKISFEQSNLTCTLDEVTYNLSTSLNEVTLILEEICFPHTWFHVIVGAQLTVIFFIITLAMLRRHKFRLYFLYLQLRTLLISKIAVDDVKTFHAFISYATPDRQWVKKRLIKNLEKRRKLKLLVASRDFEAGKLITANIHSAITTSAKTVFLISKSFLRSSWCLEEFSMVLAVSENNSYVSLQV